MSIGVGIALVVIGAILAFAIEVDLQVIDSQALGYILMLAGLVVVLLSIALMQRARRRVVTHEPAEREVVTERRTEPGGPV